MEQRNFVTYYRTSPRPHDQPNLRLDVQEANVNAFINRWSGRIVDRYCENENGRHSDRPALARALAACHRQNCMLLIAKLGGLTRNTKLLVQLQVSGVIFICADKNGFDATMLRALDLTEALAAEVKKQEVIAARRAAKVLRSPKNLTLEQQTAWRNACDLALLADTISQVALVMPLIDDMRKRGVTTMKGVAEELNERGVRGYGGGPWSWRQVRRILRHSSNEATQ